MVTAATRSPYVLISHSFRLNDVPIIRCGNVLSESTVAPEGRWVCPANLQPSVQARPMEAA